MRIVMDDGTIVERPFSVEACQGYRATSIEMDSYDFLEFSSLAARDPEGFQSAMHQLSARLPGGWASSEVSEAIRLEMLCEACPESYDAFFGDRRVGYLRLRHGRFTVECPDSGGKVVLTASPEGDGLFDPDEREKYLSMARTAIALELSREFTDPDSAFSVYFTALANR